MLRSSLPDALTLLGVASLAYVGLLALAAGCAALCGADGVCW